MTINKTKQKKQSYNDTIIEGLIERYGFQRQYIIKSIRGERVGRIPIQIQEEYKKLNAEANKVIKNKLNEL
jgi:hypothetical protein